MIPIEIRDGALKLPAQTHLPEGAQLVVLALEESDPINNLSAVADAGGAFDFLQSEPDLYSDSDILPGRKNPRFRSSS